MLIGIIVGSIAAFLILMLLLFAVILDKVVFGVRYDKKPYLKYFTAEDFNLSAEPVSVTDKLNGYIYSGEKRNGKLLIFCHGMGPGHIAYTTEIAYFCKLGYTVLAVDSLGCNLSKGKSMRGMYEGVRTAEYAIRFAESREELKGLPIYLLGHSWGGYVVLCVTKTPKIKGVVAISAPVSPSKTLSHGAEGGIPKLFAKIYIPVWYIVNFFKFGKNGNLNAAKCADKCNVPTLLIHGDCDEVVNKANSVYYKAKGKEEKYLTHGKAHNPYNTLEAEKQLANLMSADPEKDKRFFEDFDFKKATEEDEEVMKVISDFFDKH